MKASYYRNAAILGLLAKTWPRCFALSGTGAGRSSRYEETGPIWLLQKRPVVALTEATAAIENPKTGNVTTYRRHNKPAFGSLGDSLDDLK
jgi:hypothetical protein